MQSIDAGSHTICFNENAYEALAGLLRRKSYSGIFILVDSHTSEQCLPHFLAHLATEATIEIIEIEPGENVKTIETCLSLWQALTELGADRKSVLVNLGGGVVTDIGGFVASAYKRGVEFINVPTTLLGMVDAAIGGKNGVDLGHLKNQVGTITSPQLVVVDTAFLETLPQPQMRSGLAEMMKHGLIADEHYWSRFEHPEQTAFEEFDALIYRSVEIKNAIVTEDLTENGIRKTLNFGHTLGHAIESHFLETGRNLLHGEAIAAGMVMESFLSVKKGLLAESDYCRIKSGVDNVFEKLAFSENDVAGITALLAHDKKNEYGSVLFVLLARIGQPAINQTVEKEWIDAAFSAYQL